MSPKIAATIARLGEIEGRCEGATKGPWRATNYGEVLEASQDYTPLSAGFYVTVSSHQERQDSDFIASARTDIPDLVEAVRGLVGLVEDARWSGMVRALPGKHEPCCPWCCIDKEPHAPDCPAALAMNWRRE